MAGTKMTHVPYKGTGAALTDLLGGQVQLIFGSMPSMVPQNKSGKLRGIAVTTAKRIAAVPDNCRRLAKRCPDMRLLCGMPAWGPKNLPKDIVTRLNAEISKAIQTPVMQERMAGEGLEPGGGPPQRFQDSAQARCAEMAEGREKEANVKSIQ
jgi:tripartite-type tricarboxylate transporter receptor subunit TctC